MKMLRDSSSTATLQPELFRPLRQVVKVSFLDQDPCGRFGHGQTDVMMPEMQKLQNAQAWDENTHRYNIYIYEYTTAWCL